jgi:ribosomal-protein-alanine N-acetyltransferase
MDLLTEKVMILSNKTIELKKMTMRYADDFFRIFNHPEISHYSIIPYPLKLTWVKNYIRKSMEKFDQNEKFTWGIFRKSDEQFVGVAVLRNIDRDNHSARIGYSVGKNFHNCGYTKMAVGLILDYAFRELDLNRIEVRLDCSDERSVKLLEEMNGVKEGCLRSAAFKNGRFYDILVYSILRDEYYSV